MISMKNIVVNKVAEIWKDPSSVGLAVIATITLVLLGLGFAFGLMCFQSWLVMLLWNWVAVELFSLPALSFWMAFGLRWLCRLLFCFKASASEKG